MLYNMVDKISTYGTILIFLCLAFVHIEKAIKDFTEKEKPNKAQVKSLNNFKTDKNYLIIKSIVIAMFSTILWYLTMPDSIYILKNSSINFIEFDEINTSYILISFLLFCLTTILIWSIFKLLKK